MSDVTNLLSKIERADQRSAEELLPLVYDELRKLAADRLAKEPPGQTLQPTALVHEAFVRLVDNDRGQVWDSCGHFFAAAAESMRRILVERARRKLRQKHGGHFRRVNLDSEIAICESGSAQLLALDKALRRFEQLDPEKAELMKLRYFAGLSLQEAATTLGISRATASRYWTYAKAWLYCALEDEAFEDGAFQEKALEDSAPDVSAVEENAVIEPQ